MPELTDEQVAALRHAWTEHRQVMGWRQESALWQALESTLPALLDERDALRAELGVARQARDIGAGKLAGAELECTTLHAEVEQLRRERDGARTRSGWADGCIAKLRAESEQMAKAVRDLLSAFKGELPACGGCGRIAEVIASGELWCKTCLGSEQTWEKELPQVAALAALRAALEASHG